MYSLIIKMSSNIFGYSGASIGGFDASAALKNYVTLATGQTITGKKIFTSDLTSSNLDVGGELTIVDPINLDTCTILQNNNDTQIVNHTVSGNFEVIQTDVSAAERKTLKLSPLTTRIYNKIVRLFQDDTESNTDSILQLAANASTLDNPIVVAKDCVVACSISDGSNPALVLTNASNTSCGVRITGNSVRMGAGGTSSTPSSFISIINGGTATSSGPLPAISDSSTNIATTQWVKSGYGKDFQRYINALSNQAVVINLDGNILTETAGPCLIMISSPNAYVGVTIEFRLPPPTPAFIGKQVIIRWAVPTFALNYGVGVFNGSPPYVVAGLSEGAVAYYNLNGYVASTWVCDNVNWYLINRV